VLAGLAKISAKAPLTQLENNNFTVRGSNRDRLQMQQGPQKLGRPVMRAIMPLFRQRHLLALNERSNNTHRYLLTKSGRRIVTALLAARNADVDALNRMAA
jgi:hypothetical protein